MSISSPDRRAAHWLRTAAEWSVQVLTGLDPWICALLVDNMLTSAHSMLVLPVPTVLVKKRVLLSIPPAMPRLRSTQIDAQ